MWREHASCDTKDFVAAYDAANGVGMNPVTEEVNTMHLVETNKWCAIAKAAVALHSTLAGREGPSGEAKREAIV